MKISPIANSSDLELQSIRENFCCNVKPALIAIAALGAMALFTASALFMAEGDKIVLRDSSERLANIQI